MWACYDGRMLELCYITMQASHPERNVRRAYHLSMSQDLFAEWMIELRYGCIGLRPQHPRILCSSLEQTGMRRAPIFAVAPRLCAGPDVLTRS